MKPLLPLAISFSAKAAAECACGYTVNKTDSDQYALFTDLLETDFLHTRDVAFNGSHDIGWIPQSYNTTAKQDNGPYGMAKELRNLVPNYIENEYDWGGPGIKGVDPGLQLWVRSGLVGEEGKQMVPSAEIVSERDDILYGSFRIAMKTTAINGTCSAFFSYRNDSQEVDLEILSADQHSDSGDWPIHLVVQNTTATASPNYAGSSQMIYQMAFPPGGTVANYHEYRFDWLPERIDYYVNGFHAWTTTENIPSTPGRIHFSHWSNGNPGWSMGPPMQDAVLTVSYVKAYFNSTDEKRTEQWDSACAAIKLDDLKERTCEIPTQSDPPNPFGANGNHTGHTFFFTQHHNVTVNQTVYPLNGVGGRGFEMNTALILVGLMTAVLVSWIDVGGLHSYTVQAG